MSDSSLARLKRAERTAEDARAHLGETLSEIQDKLSPANILNEATRALREKRSEVRDQVVSGLLSRPMVATALLSAAGWAFRKKPGLAMLINLFLRGSATTRPPTHSTASRSQRPRRRRASAPAAAPEEKA